MMKNNPYVVKARAVASGHVAYVLSKLYVIGDNGKSYVACLSEKDTHKMDAVDRQNLTLWCGKNGEVAYVAGGDYLIKTLCADIAALDSTTAGHMVGHQKAELDTATAQHLAMYQRELETRLATQKRLDTIQQQIAMINLINAESAGNIEQAKKTLIDFLNTRAETVRQDLSNRR